MIYAGVRVAVDEGHHNNNTTWKLTAEGDITLDETELHFVKFASLVTPSKLSATITGDDETKDFEIHHNLGTMDVKVTVVNVDTSSIVWVDIVINDPNSIMISFANPPAEEQSYRVIIHG